LELSGGRFLVIGGAGLIGSHVVDQLLEARCAQVRIYDNFSRGTRENLRAALGDPRTEVFPGGGDILHRDVLREAMRDMDGVFHLAALWLLQCHEYPRAAFDVNVGGTMNVIETALEAGVPALVFSSSASVYGDAVSEPMNEDHPFNCQEFYGASKVCGEILLRALGNRPRPGAPPLRYVGLRYMNVYGPRQDHRGAYVGVITRVLNALDAGEPPVIHGDGSQAYDFIDVRDCAHANLLAMRSAADKRFYNVGTGIKTSIRDVVATIGELHPAKIVPRFQAADRPFVRNRIGDTARARAELGFGARIALREGLRDLIAFRLACGRNG
jgi:UDP-glucose 4-epimerase